MSGILDNKSRIMDLVVTQHGKRQMASTLGGGVLRAEYASFTDSDTYYRPDIVSGSEDASNRVFFEAGSDKQDFITFETDDTGILLGFEIDPSLTITNDQIFSTPSTTILTDFSSLTYLTGSRFASVAENIVTSSLDHFKDLYMIGTLNSDEEFNRQFLLSENEVKFIITNTSPFENYRDECITLNSLEPFFIDKRLSNVINFKFLPPMTSSPTTSPFDVEEEDSSKFLGDFEPLGGITEMTYSDLMIELNGDDSEGKDINVEGDIAIDNSSWLTTKSRNFFMSSGFSKSSVAESDVISDPPVLRESIYFTETSSDNNLLMQMFEINTDYNTFKKLDVIDFGEVYVDYDDDRPRKHVFFVGKIYFNDLRIPCFANLFTIIMD